MKLGVQALIECQVREQTLATSSTSELHNLNLHIFLGYSVHWGLFSSAYQGNSADQVTRPTISRCLLCQNRKSVMDQSYPHRKEIGSEIIWAVIACPVSGTNSSHGRKRASCMTGSLFIE